MKVPFVGAIVLVTDPQRAVFPGVICAVTDTRVDVDVFGPVHRYVSMPLRAGAEFADERFHWNPVRATSPFPKQRRSP